MIIKFNNFNYLLNYEENLSKKYDFLPEYENSKLNVKNLSGLDLFKSFLNLINSKSKLKLNFKIFFRIYYPKLCFY
jgi:hypothetical protein